MLDYKKLYRLPFSKNDNFNGWIEVTTKCNLNCPGCYRGCDAVEHIGKNKSLEEIKTEILELTRIRNCSMISISGGEPLIHPDIKEIVMFVKSLRLNPILFTNGTLLTVKKLKELKKSGLTGVVVRKDSLQDVESKDTELDINRERMKIAKMCNYVGIHLTLTAVLDPTNIKELKDILLFGSKNHKSVGQHLFTLKRSLELPSKPIDNSETLSLEKFVDECEKPESKVDFVGYLGNSRIDQSAKWLQAFRFVFNGEVIGFSDKKWVEFFQMIYHYKTGKYAGILKKRYMSLSIVTHLILALINRSMRGSLKKRVRVILKSPLLLFSKVTIQPITVVIPPDFVDGKRDLCDACPDAIFHNGKLVPSCLLEEIIGNEN